MQIAEPLVSSWTARLALDFSLASGRTIISGKRHDGPLLVQKPFYPEGQEVCHAIVVHPPGGIAGGDELTLQARVERGAAVLMTTPGATRWYRSAGPRAKQRISLAANGLLEWLPQESIVFDGALAEASCEIDLEDDAGLIGWDIVCLGRSGSGERFTKGCYRFSTAVRRRGKLLWLERGRIDGGGRLLESPAGLAGNPVFGTLYACARKLTPEMVSETRKLEPQTGTCSLTHLPGILLARYLGGSSESARRYFVALWRMLRPALCGREAVPPRIWET